MSCDQATQIHRYHDGELTESERRRAEAHLAECRACGQLLGELADISRLVGTAPQAQMPPGFIDRLQRRRPGAEDRAIIRIAGCLTAMAACIMIATLLTWPSSPTETSAPAVWQSVAVTPTPDINDGPGVEMVVLAQWMADDLASSRNGELR